ncbi:MAG: glycosyltransferase [Candidatus Scalindua sp. AMX11]|nr:MAG: glycosyltransferase [Candidatus Scalindua sp.]NOG84127.1 glycosyltransferase family 2 protein [Planctomycetota bacterium]RZV99005.1 MAG: glycosyltransferase [Candidatus Scalindua sp. SCAELEC01]TDE66845.1 MAG: glycosyltransferase [Candidatus Scalindua sp. AMX11]GJQ57644.1 MAG: bactoprenol glucosyl transferase [Candidatus Scalindua sp.]
MYNEEENVDLFLTKLIAILTKLTCDYTIICVNDGSTDNTLNKLLAQYKKNSSIKIINLSRNFGKEKALTAGLDFSQGDVVIPIDSDLQDPPELIQDMVSQWKKGFDVVYATRRIRHGESWFKRSTASFFYKLINAISETPIPENTGDFRLIDKRVINAIRQLPEEARFMKGIFSWVGFKQTSVMYDRQPRNSGKTSWNYWRLWNFAIDGFTSFSHLPIKIWSYIGFTISFLSLIYALILVSYVLTKGIKVPGYASLMVVILFLGGINLIGLGVLGEYVGRIFIQVKRRPLYLVRELWGFERDLS